MYSVVKSFLDRLGDSDNQIRDLSHEDTRTAIAVLYYRVIVVDGRIRPEELHLFRTVLGETLGVTEDELLLFEDHVLELIKTEKSLLPFISIVEKLPIEKRREILRHMEEISLSDRELHEFEINLVARTAELLGLSNEWKSVKKK